MTSDVACSRSVVEGLGLDCAASEGEDASLGEGLASLVDATATSLRRLAVRWAGEGSGGVKERATGGATAASVGIGERLRCNVDGADCLTGLRGGGVRERNTTGSMRSCSPLLAMEAKGPKRSANDFGDECVFETSTSWGGLADNDLRLEGHAPLLR